MRRIRKLTTEAVLVLVISVTLRAATVVNVQIENALNEGDPSLGIVLVRSGDSSFPLSVDYRVRESLRGSRIGSPLQEGTLELQGGETRKKFKLPNPLVDNGTVDRRDRRILIELANPSAGVLVGIPAYADVLDNEFPNIVDSGFRLETGKPVVRARALGAAPDGKLLALVNSTNIVQLMPDGLVDPAFEPFGLNGLDVSFAGAYPQTNGDWVVWLQRHEFNELRAGDILRLRASGSVDPAFEPTAWLNRFFGGTNVWFQNSAIQSSGQLLVQVGDFTGRNVVVRFKADGTRDEQFTPITDPVLALLVQADDRIVASQYTSSDRFAIVRYQKDGAADRSFRHHFAEGTFVQQIALERDQKVLVAGSFPNLLGKYGWTIIRLHTDGSRDLSFQMEIDPEYQIQDVIALPNNQILAGYPNANEVRRYNSDGSLDEVIPMYWAPPTILADGRLVMSVPLGWFSTLVRFDLSDAARPGVTFASSELYGLHHFPLMLDEWRGADLAPVGIRRLGDSSKPLTITASARNGSATEGEDFVFQTKEITFGPFATEKNLSFQLLDDPELEPEENFHLALTGQEITGQSQLEVRILNDEAGAILRTPRVQREGLEISIAASDNLEWKVETSLDLKTWTVEKVELERDIFGRLMRGVDPQSFHHPARFYRLSRRD